MNIVKGKKYKLKGKSRYFLEKYGSYNPEIDIEGSDAEIWGKSWIEKMREANISCALFASRVKMEKLDIGQAYYGKIKQGDVWLGEVVFDNELEEL